MYQSVCVIGHHVSWESKWLRTVTLDSASVHTHEYVVKNPRSSWLLTML